MTEATNTINRSPRVVLVATPFDTSFIKTPEGGIPTAVLYRYHAHWYGSDPDGKVIGYSVIVTDTNAVPGISDFQDPSHFTTRTDSIFTFTVTANTQRYPHTLWVTAVDDKFKADFNPAHVILNAEDRYLPEPVLDESYAITPGGAHIQLADASRNTNIAPRDTIPLGSSVHFKWHAAPKRNPFQAEVVGFKVRIGASYVFTTDTSITYPADKLLPGRNEFHIRGVDAVLGETGAGGAPDTLRVFSYNFAPGTWFTDPNTLALPAELRPIQRRFQEVRDGKVYAHTDGDTISRRSDIRIAFGGWDRDGQIRGFSVQVKNSLMGGGGSQPPPTPSTPPSGSIEVFEPYLHAPFEFKSSAENFRAGVRSFIVRGFDYQGQVDPKGSKITVVCGFRPFFKAPLVKLTYGPNQRFPFTLPDTLVVDSVYVGQSLTCVALGFDGNDPTGNTPISGSGYGAEYTFTLDPESATPVTYTLASSVSPAFSVPSTAGLHILEVTVNDFLSGQLPADGRQAKLRIPFFVKSKR
ncbi:MAG: hypothetical protein HZB25_02150 [Candidatus Eisenbacteria bacterium]|nr:hypothetical protein [Candidatus Eisenbacteria bacterium]